MKILHLSTARTWRGGEQQVSYLYQGLEAKGCQQCIITPYDSKMALHAKQRDYVYKELRKKTFFTFQAVFQIDKFCQSFKPDIIHCHDAKAHSIAFFLTRFFSYPYKVLVSRRVDFPIRSNWFSKMKYRDKNMLGYLCVSSAIKKILEQDLGYKNFVVIHDGIDINRFSKPPSGKLRKVLGVDQSCLLIGCVAALAPHKDYFTLIKSISLLKKSLKQPFKVAIIGTGSLLSRLENEIKRLNLKDSISILGQRHDVPELLADLDLFLLTSKEEGLCQTLLEAMAAKVPIVATRAGGIPEIIEDQKNGLLADVGHTQDLAKHIKYLLKNPPISKLLAQEGWKKVQNFSYQKMAEQTFEIYQKTLA